ncbi:alpha/beta hydrolase [Muricauda brasiliensis]|uniref:alpha/beta hydrolase n=1 Tax=Muricauda brasiliensis TaxID=2162892 RepID=UPI000D3A30C4|nr:alpha/beta hydrolase [Muricauda brasiliensis]
MVLKNIFGLAVLFMTGLLSAQLEEKPVTLTTETGNIQGTMLLPRHSDKIPVVLIIAGSGPTDRNGNNPMMKNNSLKMLAEGLGNHGIASVRFDKRGIAESTEAGIEESSLKFETYIEDARDWIDLLKENDSFSEIVVLGHSEGSLIGMIASQDPTVDRFISVAGVGEPAAKQLERQLKAQPSFVWEQSEPILQNLEMGKKVDSVPQMLYALFRPSVQPYLISWFEYNPQTELAKLDKPVLLIQGTTDIQVDMQNVEQLHASNPKSEKVILEGMNHILKEAEMDRMKNIETYSNPDLPLKDGLITAIVDFIKNSGR